MNTWIMSPQFDVVSCFVLLGLIALIIIYRLTRGR